MDDMILAVDGEPYEGPVETGRVFIHDDYNVKLVTSIPDHDEWHRWTELKAPDGELIYVSDHEGYTLDAEEFGPIEEGTALTADEYRIMFNASEVGTSYRLGAPDEDDTPFGRGGDYCPWCGADWKAPHERECARPEGE